jgi:prepilin-type N-terminal cleavage/methylation domain-containing protein
MLILPENGVAQDLLIKTHRFSEEDTPMYRKQSGFTLVEIAIVLVIIGLLLGGVLKGQELINSAKVKNLATDFRNIPLFIYGYQDKYKAIPGDQAQAALDVQFPPANTAAACTPASATCAQGNGVLNGAWTDAAVTSETFVFWQHVRLANLAAGPTNTADATYRPRNADGGLIGIQSTVVPYIAGMAGTYMICSDGILGKFVKQLDTTVDDGNPSTGTMRAVPSGSAVGTAGTATAAIVDANGYTVCLTF